MSNYKFDIDPKLPDDAKIERQKNFQKVMGNYHRMTRPMYQTPLYKYRNVFLGLVLLIVLVWLVVETEQGRKNAKELPKNDSAQTDTIPSLK